MKKLFRLLLFALIITLSLAACSNNKSDNTSSEPSNDTTKKDSANESSSTENNSSGINKNKFPSNKEPSIKNIKCRLYFFNPSELKHYYIDKTIPVQDGALVSALTKELQNTSYNKDFLVLTNKVTIKSAKIDKKNGILKVVFSDSYTDFMLLGTSTESGLLTSLLATYGYNLGVNKIIIYFNDKPYTGLGDFDKGYFSVEYPTAEKMN